MGMTNFAHGVKSFGIPLLWGNEDGQVWGDTFFVDATSGSDSNDGKTPETAKVTIQAGLNLCTTAKGDRVFVRNGAYAETLTMTKDDVQLIGQSNTDVIVTGATDATDTLVISGNECTVKNMRFEPYDGGSDISLIKITGDGCIIKSCVFNSGEYQIETSGADNTLVLGCHFITPVDVTDGASIIFEDSNDCKVLYSSFFIDANSDAIVHHDADNLEVAYNCAVGDDDTGASAGCFVWIVGADGTSELSVHDNRVTLFAAVVGEDGAAVAAHGYGTSDVTVANLAVTGDGNQGLGCTVGFDTTDE